MGITLAHYRQIHQPRSQAEAEGARKWFKFFELFYMQLALAVRQARRGQATPNVRCVNSPGDIGQYFPFTLTTDQMRAVCDILADMGSGRVMNRLLQADVGAGKTVVAAWAAIIAAMNGAQVAILCPTEVLARQHYETIRGYFERAGVSHSLVLGGKGSKYDTRTSDITIGTTAILSDAQAFSRLGLVIIDEQHKFGVEQRAALKRHGNPHMLVMTATPIPRTLAMTVFGDLDVSTIKSMPPGRKPVETQWVAGMSDGLRQAISHELQHGHQVYVVCPRIEALDDEMRAVEEVAIEYTRLFPGTGVGNLHGKMHPTDRQKIMDAFRANQFGILVSTTVIEVGVDNPNATVMVVEGAERFGLAQLHQLRGRVGRGKDQSYCFLLSDSDSSEAKARLRAMEQTNSGFEIAEQDLKLRGPGSLLDTQQHGLPPLRIADIVDDFDILLEARKDAFAIAEADPTLSAPEHQGMRSELLKRFGDKITLGDAG